MEYTVHDHGIVDILPSKTVATFPVGTFLENIAVRSNGNILVSSMLAGKIYQVDPKISSYNITELHDFNSNPSDLSPISDDITSPYGLGMISEAIVEDPNTPDVFYTFSGQHGKRGSWAVWSLDLRNLDQDESKREVIVAKIADVPSATWLNGGTMLPSQHTLLIAESLQGQVLSCHIPSRKVSIWLEHELFGKISDREPWPGTNGLQFFRGEVYCTNSDRGMVLRLGVVEDNGRYEEGSVKVIGERIVGDDLAFDREGNAYIATNPCQTVVKLSGVGFHKESKTLTILGGAEVAESAGPTAVAFGRGEGEEKLLYVVTNGGIVAPVGGEVVHAKVIQVDVGVEGEF